jgi:hypothetical protein
MIFTKTLEYEDIRKNLDKDNDVITMIGCETCVRVAGSGGQERMKDLALQLRSDGYNVKDGFMVPTACTPKIFLATIGRDVNTILSLACEAGSANLERSYPECKLVKTIKDVGLMITDTDKEVLQVTLPYEGNDNEAGKEFQLFTGERNENGNSQSIMKMAEVTEVAK